MKSNIMQHLSQCFPGHWIPSPPSSPLSEDLCIDMFSIFLVFVSMLQTRVPLESFKRRRPNSLYLVLISSAMLIIPFLPRNLMHSSKVGQSEIQRYELLCNIRLVYRTKNLDQSITQKKATNEALKNCLVYELST